MALTGHIWEHLLGQVYRDGMDERPVGVEVARFLLPVPVRGLDRLASQLEMMYGKGLVLHQSDTWLVVSQAQPS